VSATGLNESNDCTEDPFAVDCTGTVCPMYVSAVGSRCQSRKQKALCRFARNLFVEPYLSNSLPDT